MRLKIFNTLIILLLAFSLPVKANNDYGEAVKKIEIAVPLEASFFFRKDEKTNEARGFYPELLKEVATENKIEFTFNFVETDLFYSGDYENYIGLGGELINYFTPRSFIYYLGEEEQNLKSLMAKKEKIALIKDSPEDAFFKDKLTPEKIIYVSSTKEGISLLKDEKVMALGSTWQPQIFDGLKRTILEEVVNQPLGLHIADKETKDLLSDELDRIEDVIIQGISTQERIDYYSDFFSEYDFELKKLNISLPSEKNFFPLYRYDKGEYIGMAIDYLETINRVFGHSDAYMNHYNHGKEIANDIIIGYVKTPERLDTTYFTNPLYNLNLAVANQSKEGFINSINQIDNHILAVVDGYFYLDFLNDNLKNPKFIYVKDTEEALLLVSEGRADFVIQDSKYISNVILSDKIDNIKIAGTIASEQMPVAIGVEKQTPNSQEIFTVADYISDSFGNEFFLGRVYLSHNINYNMINYQYVIGIFIAILILLPFIFTYSRQLIKLIRAKRLHKSVVSSLVTINNYNDTDTGDHIKRLGLYSKFLAQKSKCKRDFIYTLAYFAPLHDIGKVGIPPEILKKPGPLTPEEFEIMKTHTIIGEDIVKNIKISIVAKNIIKYHHEKWNGSGYPQGLKEEEIPLEARMVSLADTYDALRQKRVYKEAFSHQKACEIIEEESGKSFDPKLVKLFLKHSEVFDEIFNNNQPK